MNETYTVCACSILVSVPDPLTCSCVFQIFVLGEGERVCDWD